jgi:SAM-dependent methyltransferase
MPELRVSPPAPHTAPAATRSMERLDFKLPDFTRVAWVSDAARDAWMPRLNRIMAAWLEIEWRAITAGVRRCAIATASPEEFLTQATRWADLGLSAMPIEMMGVSSQAYSATPVATEPGKPFVFRFVLGTIDDVATFKRAWEAADDEIIGDLLGYPPCCREFFRRVWVDDAMVDTTWPMAVASSASLDGTTTIEVDGPPQANILWRWMGARAVPHLPCRVDCAATVELADRLLAVGRDLGFGEEMDWLLEILSWPVEWSALHGIAEVKTPVLKVSTRTDATAGRYVVRREGSGFPAEGAHGLGPPFRVPVKLRLSPTRGFRRGLENAAEPRSRAREEWYATDNGFPSITAMNDAHRPVVEVAAAALGRRGGNVLDLGCGNGALLEKLAAASPGVVPFGIDNDPGRIAHARELHPGSGDRFVVGDLFDDHDLWRAPGRFALGIVMPGRLLEVDPDRAATLLARLRDHCDQVLVYAYGDWLAREGGLAELSRKAGIAVSAASGHGAAIADSVRPVPRAPLGEERT